MIKEKIDNIYYRELILENLEKMYDVVRKTCKNKYGFFCFLLIRINIFNKLYTKTYKPSKFIFLIYLNLNQVLL